MILTVILDGISKAAAVLLVLVKVYTIPCHDRGHINIMLVLQSCSDSLHILPGSSSDTCAASSDCAYHVGNMKVEKDLNMQGEERVNVKTEKDIGSEEEEGEKDIDIKEEEDVGIKGEVSLEGTM